MDQMIVAWRLQKADLTWRNRRLPRPTRINSSFYQSVSLYMPTDKVFSGKRKRHKPNRFGPLFFKNHEHEL